MHPAPATFRFRFTPPFTLAAGVFGVGSANAWLRVDEHDLTVRYGPWSVATPLHNVAAASVTGPYLWPKVIGPARLSLSDRGLTFASNPDRGVCICFREPVQGIEPLHLVGHPNLTVTVADPEGLVEALRDVGARRGDLEEQREVQHVHDRLHGCTVAELRDLARSQGIAHSSARRKAELVELLEAELDDEHLHRLLDER